MLAVQVIDKSGPGKIHEVILVYYRLCKQKQVSLRKHLKTPGACAIHASDRIFKPLRKSVLRLSRTFERKGYREELPSERYGDARRNIIIKPLKKHDLGVARVLLNP